MIDHRKLLKWYMDYVGASEGTDFLGKDFSELKYSDLTPEENAELARLRDEARAEWRARQR